MQFRMTAYHQNTTTAYSRDNSSIVSLERVGEPQLAELSADLYRYFWNYTLVPGPGTSQGGNLIMIDAMTFCAAWVLRLYKDLFPDADKNPVVYLQNWMAIPLQFMSLCTQYANYSVPSALAGRFTMPANTTTTARGGRSMQRFVGQVWAGWLFITTAAVTVGVAGATLMWIVAQRHPVPEGSGVPEMDLVARIGEDDRPSGEVQGGMTTLTNLARGKHLDKRSAWNIGRDLGTHRMRLVERRDPQGGDSDLSLLVTT